VSSIVVGYAEIMINLEYRQIILGSSFEILNLNTFEELHGLGMQLIWLVVSLFVIFCPCFMMFPLCGIKILHNQQNDRLHVLPSFVCHTHAPFHPHHYLMCSFYLASRHYNQINQQVKDITIL